MRQVASFEGMIGGLVGHHLLQGDCPLGLLVNTTHHPNLVVAKMLQIDVPDNECALYAVCGGHIVHFVVLVIADKILNVKIKLIEVPVNTVERVALHSACDFSVRVYIGNLTNPNLLIKKLLSLTKRFVPGS